MKKPAQKATFKVNEVFGNLLYMVGRPYFFAISRFIALSQVAVNLRAKSKPVGMSDKVAILQASANIAYDFNHLLSGPTVSKGRFY
jgi:hypothetical protein